MLKDVITILNQYFPELIDKFEGLTDLRHQSYVEYKLMEQFNSNKSALFDDTDGTYNKATIRKRS